MRTSIAKTVFVYIIKPLALCLAAVLVLASGRAVASIPEEFDAEGPKPTDYQTELSHDQKELLNARTELSLIELKTAKNPELAQDPATHVRLGELRAKIQSLKWKVGYVPPSTPYSKTIRAKLPKDGYSLEVNTENARRKFISDQFTTPQLRDRPLPGCAGNNLCQGSAN